MLYIDGLDLTNVISFKEVSVDFKSTLTYIRGVNKDSDLARPTGNGTGKSLFFSAIPNVWYSSAPLSLRKKSRKDMLSRKGSSIGLIYRPSESGPEYEIIQKPNGYTIFENGNDLEITTIPRAEAYIKNLFPISEIEFYSRCYISTQRPYSLLRDSDSDRLQHIVDIARLDQYSTIHKYFLSKAGSIKDNEIRLSVLEQQLANLKKKLKSVQSTITKDEYDNLKTQYEACAAKLEKLQAQRFELLEQQKALNSLLSVEKELDTLRKSYKFKKAPEQQITLLKADKKAAQAWATYDERKTHAKTAIRKFDARIAEIEAQLPKKATGELQRSAKTTAKELASVSEELAHMQAISDQVEELEGEIVEAQSAFDELGITSDQIDLEKNYDEAIAEAKLRLKLEALLEHEEAHEDSGKCPTCQSDIDFEAIRRIVKGERKALSGYQAKKKAQSLYKELKVLKKRRGKLSFDKAAFIELKTRKKALTKTLSTVEEYLEQFDELASVKKMREGISMPDRPSSDRPALSIDDIEAGIELCHEIEKHLKVKSALLADHEEFKQFRSATAVKEAVLGITEKLSSKQKEIRKIESQQATYSDGISSYEQFINTVNIYEEERSATEAEIAKLKPSVEDKKLVTILTKAYGPKGLRAYAANSFCSLLEANLNHYRDLIFAEPFEFKVEASDTGVSILVDRNTGKVDDVSDVRHLSGAESECFSLLCAASLIMLTPDNRKLNMIVLDEPTSHMHAVTRELFNQKFIPFLRELVPSVFIITPHDDDTGPNSVEWVVQKHKGISKLIQMQ